MSAREKTEVPGDVGYAQAKKMTEDLEGNKAWLVKVRKANEIQLSQVSGRVHAPQKWPVELDLALLKVGTESPP